MEFVEGPNLAQVVRDNPLPPARAANYVRTIAEAVHYAHERGVLHRDLKPSNILLDSLDQPRVTDFGLAKNLSSDPELTEAGQVLGAPSFIPPEQAAGLTEEVGRHSDVYALGGILYYLLTGHPPFAAETPLATIARVLHHDPIPPRKLNANIPQRLENICLKCLEKRPQRRYPTAKDLADELGRFQRNEPIQAGNQARHGDMGRPWPQRNYVIVGAFSAIVLLLIAGITYWRTRQPETSARDTAQSSGQTNKALPQADSSLQSAGGETTNLTKSGEAKVVEREISGQHSQADKSQASAGSKGPSSVSDIYDAAGTGDLGRVKALLVANVDVNAPRADDGVTALMTASEFGHLDVVRVLLDAKAEVNAKMNNGGTALILASSYGHLDVVRALLDAKADANAKAGNGGMALMLASEKGHFEVVQALLDAKADVNGKANDGMTPLIFASQFGHLDVVQTLLAAKADVNFNPSKGGTALIMASQQGYEDVVKTLLAAKADANTQANYDGSTALMLASQNDHIKIVRDLLSANADVNAKAANGVTALIAAANQGRQDVVRLLLDTKADVNAKMSNGNTALHVAIDSGHTDVADLLRQNGGLE
jgi:ankyrin repeat protein